MERLIILQLTSNQSLTSHHYRCIHINRLDGIKKEAGTFISFSFALSKASLCVCAWGRKCSRQGGVAGGCGGHQSGQGRHMAENRPLWSSNCPGKISLCYSNNNIYVIIIKYKSPVTQHVIVNMTDCWFINRQWFNECPPEDVWPLQQAVNRSMGLSFLCFGERIWEAKPNQQRKQISGGDGHQENGSGLWKPPLPRAALDSAIWSCLLQKPVKFSLMGPN